MVTRTGFRGRTWRGLSVLLAVGLGFVFPTLASAPAKIFHSTLGFRLVYPSDWRLAGSEGVFMAENFPPDKAVKGVVLPPDGALIVVDVISKKEPKQERSLQDWVATATARQEVVSKRSFDLERPSGRLNVDEVRARCCSYPPFQDSTGR